MPDPYRPGEDPAFYPDETGPRPRRRDQGRRDADRSDAGRSAPGRRGTGRRAPEPPEQAPRDPAPRGGTRRDQDPRGRPLRDPPPRDRGLRGPDPRDRTRRDPDTRNPALRNPALRGPDTRDPAPRNPALRRLATRDLGPGEPGAGAVDPVRPAPGYPDPLSPDWGQVKPEQIEPRQSGPRQSGTAPGGRGQSEPGQDRSSRRRQSAPGGPSWRWGELSGGRGTLIVLAAAVIGTGVTVAMHRDPGYLLEGAVIVGTLIATLAVRWNAVYQLIPAPALTYLAGALAAGLLQVQSTGSSRSGLAVMATQWIAGGFVAMAAATAVAIVVTVIRWLMNRHGGTPRRLPEPEPPASDRPSSQTGFATGPETGPWSARPRPASAPAPGR
ncbi:MAG: DUF6542 domain-containing protein, partial [Streptosporangiaceae bacterium]